MKVWAILDLNGKYPMVFGHDSHSVWRNFFPCGVRGSMAEAIEAYEAIGYKATEYDMQPLPAPPVPPCDSSRS